MTDIFESKENPRYHDDMVDAMRYSMAMSTPLLKKCGRSYIKAWMAPFHLIAFFFWWLWQPVFTTPMITFDNLKRAWNGYSTDVAYSRNLWAGPRNYSRKKR